MAIIMLIRNFLSNMKLNSVIKSVVIMICSTGLLFQLEQISERYFKYQTRSEPHLSVPNTITPPLISSCWYLKDAMKDSMGKSRSDYYKLLNNLTIKEIFDQTPKSGDFLNQDKACLIRFPHKMTGPDPYYNSIECKKLIKITRFIQRDFICYRVEVTAIKLSTELDLIEYSLTPYASGTLFRFYLNNNPFSNVTAYTMFAHSELTSDLYDSLFSRIRCYMGTVTSTDVVNHEVEYWGVSIERLKVPYETACRNFHPFSSGAEYRMDGLRNETAQKLKMIPTFDQIFESDPIVNLGYKMISATKFQDENFLKKFNLIYKKYNQTYLDCYLEYYVTSYSITFGPIPMIAVFWPQQSRIDMKHVPSYDSMDYVLYMCSSFGIWLGLSMLSIGNFFNSIVTKYQNRKEPKDGGCPTNVENVAPTKCQKFERYQLRLNRSMYHFVKSMKHQLDSIDPQVKS